MSHIVTFDDGETLDLDTKLGAYKHVGRFLRENGAPSDFFSSLGKLFPRESEPHPDLVKAQERNRNFFRVDE